jgi:hypothetical protein
MKLKKKPESLPKDAFDVFCKVYEKFVVAETARRKYLEFCKSFKVLEKCKILQTVLHGKGELSSSSEQSE